MPIAQTTTTTAGDSYGSIRVGDGHGIHQSLLNAAALAGNRDARGYLPPGLPLQANGLPVTGISQTVVCVVGPEAVLLGTANIFGNAIFTGMLNVDMIEDNLGRALNANELSALALADAIVLI